MNLKHTLVTFETGSVIFKDGDPRTALYIVQAGQIAIFKMSPTGERLPLAIIGSGEYLGETGLLDNKPTHATFAVALTDTELISIPSQAIEEQLKHAPTWLVALSRGLAQKLRRTNELMRRNKVADAALDAAMLAVQAQGEIDHNKKANKKAAPKGDES